MIELHPADKHTFDRLLNGQSLAPSLAVCPGGLAPPEVMAIVADMAAKVRADFAGDSAWLVVAQGEAVGLISYKAAPCDGVVDIGYGIAEARQGRRHASDAVRALADIGRATGIRMLTAETSVDNQASRRVLENAGFRKVGERDDPEDGPLICWALDLLGLLVPEGME
jgi:RimJ/RimL family protein N-acetyltransferase